MKTNISVTPKNEGMALIAAILFMAVMGILAMSTASRISNHSRHVDSYEQYQEAYLGMTSAYEQGQGNGLILIGVPVGTSEFLTTMAEEGMAVTPYIGEAMDSFQDGNTEPQLSQSPNIQYSVVEISTDFGLAGFAEDAVYATSRYVIDGNTTVTRTILGVNRYPTGGLPNINVWTNAIFAGVQQSGNTINGNVSVHGSVHILGEDAVLGDTSVVLPDVIELSGGAGIFNNYDGMPADLEARLDTPLPIYTDDDGNEFEYLETNFRVKNGMVNINGNTSIGQASAEDGSKSTVDGVYVNNEWMGNKTSEGVPVDGVVYSDNGYAQGYDLGNAINFPSFEEEVNESYDGQIYFDATDDTSFYAEDQVAYVGDVTLVSNDPDTSFYYNATPGIGTGSNAVLGTDPTTATDPTAMPSRADVEAMAANGEFVIWYDGNTHELFVNGRVAIDGDINILSGNGNSNKIIEYEGQGSLLAYDADGDGDGGNVVMDASFLTTDFPLTNVVGLMSAGDFDIGNSSQISLMGGFYAQGGISVNRQTNIIGSIVADFFDMGNNVPDIYWVPEIANAWTDDTRMIGMGVVTAPGGAGADGIWFEVGVPL